MKFYTAIDLINQVSEQGVDHFHHLEERQPEESEIRDFKPLSAANRPSKQVDKVSLSQSIE